MKPTATILTEQHVKDQAVPNPMVDYTPTWLTYDGEVLYNTLQYDVILEQGMAVAVKPKGDWKFEVGVPVGFHYM